MASFEDFASQKSQKNAIASLPKHPLKRFEPALEKFINIALPTDLKRLQRHQINMEKLYETNSWQDLNAEQINAARTVQQLKVNIKEMENIRCQIIQSDVALFDERVAPLKDEALQGVRSFREVQRMYSQRPKRTLQNQEGISEGEQGISSLNTDYQQKQLLLEEETAASWGVLQEDQQSMLDTISDNIETTHVNVSQGTEQLGKARKLQAAMLPVIGALIGTAAGGPVGFVFGLKLGAAAALGGGIAGYAGGEMIKKKNQQNVDIELENMSSNKENRIVKKNM